MMNPGGQKYPTIGSIERLDPQLDTLLAQDVRLERLVGEFDWSEGPTWLKNEQSLVFSDVPQNTVYKWNEREGLSVYVLPSGYSHRDDIPRGGEPGSNGLTTDAQGRLVLAQHGDRRIARLNPGDQLNPNKTFTTIVDNYQGKKFNSPNDLVYDSKGNLYFTDPPYGLEKRLDDPKKELPFQGVFRVGVDGKLTLLVQDLKYPNGIALSPDEKTLYVAVSDPQNAIWMAYDLKEDGTVANGRVFANVTSMVPGNKGLPDGMKIDSKGNLWATGPGGVLIFNPQGKHLGTIRTGQATGNCAWGDDGSTLYVMADMWLCRIRTKVKGKGWE
jgi:gluconolactonase